MITSTLVPRIKELQTLEENAGQHVADWSAIQSNAIREREALEAALSPEEKIALHPPAPAAPAVEAPAPGSSDPITKPKNR